MVPLCSALNRLFACLLTILRRRLSGLGKETTVRRLRLFGEYLRDESRVSSRQLVEALREQVISRDSGKPRRLGEILVSLGYVSPQDVERAASRQSSDMRGGSAQV